MMRDRNRQDNVSLAIAYVPWHNWDELFEPADALERGTAFPCLEMPFYGKGARQR